MKFIDNLVCLIFGHQLEKYVFLTHEADLKFAMREIPHKRIAHVCVRCGCLVFGKWKKNENNM